MDTGTALQSRAGVAFGACGAWEWEISLVRGERAVWSGDVRSQSCGGEEEEKRRHWAATTAGMQAVRWGGCVSGTAEISRGRRTCAGQRWYLC